MRLRPATLDDIDALVAIRATPEVTARWGSDHRGDLLDALSDEECHVLAIEDSDAKVIGQIQWLEEEDPGYRHAGIDLFLDPAEHGRGLGTDALRALITHLIDTVGHHRISIDPAADNEQAIRCYERVGFKPVGVLRRNESIDGGDFHDSLLMDLLSDEFIRRSDRH